MADSRQNNRQNSGGYDFGGYVPGADYQPKKPPKWKAAVVLLILIGLVAGYAIILL